MVQAKTAAVVVAKDGPYLVSGAAPLARQTIVADAEGGSEAWKQGDLLPARKKYSLCR